ncbi:heterokaryon incompatibility protein-domain-containing protein [Halenospora varia]|nr:heterokaryon incompatibility protein-domain-containing protein [Halenospora varia]
MAFRTGYFHPRLLRQYGIATVHGLVFVLFLVGVALIIKKLSRHGSLSLIGLLLILPPACALVQFVLWFLLVVSENFPRLPATAALIRYWYLPRKTAKQLWLRLKIGPQRKNIHSPFESPSCQIRLLVINHGQRSEQIVCSLINVDLGSSSPKFEALSYTWGSNNSMSHIILNDSPFLVTPNLYGALKYMRLENTDRLVWVDALCIDQSNNDERGIQVSLMRKIYFDATETIIWLGCETPTSNLAMRYLLLASSVNDRKTWFADRLRSNFVAEKQEWKAVLELFRRDYWKRVWIIQETAVSSKLIVSCGEHTIAWELAVAAQHAWINFRANAVSRPFQVMIEIIEDMSAGDGTAVSLGLVPRNPGPMALSMNRNRIASHEPSSLIELLRDNWTALATDPRDKIYALLGLATDCSTPPLAVDYSMSQFETYLTTMKYLLCHYGNLDMISYSGIHILPAPSYVFRVPSWIPTFYWSWEAPTTAASSQYIYKSTPVPFAASATHKAIASFQPNLQRFDNLLGIRRFNLRAQGCRIDRISKKLYHAYQFKALSPELYRLKKRLNIATDWLPHHLLAGTTRRGEDRDLVDIIRTLYYYFVHDGEEERELQNAEGQQEINRKTNSLWRTLVFNRTFDGDLAPDSWSSLFSVLINGPSSLPPLDTAIPTPHNHSASPSTALSDPNSTSNLPHTLEETKPDREARAAEFIQPLLQTIRNLRISGRALFLTEKNHLCIANGTTQVGDYVCVILGCAIPMVMQEVGESLTTEGELGNRSTKAVLNGVSYLHEYMYGKAIEEVESGELKLEWFDFQ